MSLVAAHVDDVVDVNHHPLHMDGVNQPSAAHGRGGRRRYLHVEPLHRGGEVVHPNQSLACNHVTWSINSRARSSPGVSAARPGVTCRDGRSATLPSAAALHAQTCNSRGEYFVRTPG